MGGYFFKTWVKGTHDLNKLFIINFNFMTKKITILILLFAFLASTTSLTFAQTAYNKENAKNYLSSRSQSPWAVMGLSALGIQSTETDFLKNVNGNSAIDFEAPILALASLNKDPRTFGTQNLVEKLKSFKTQNQLGDPSTVNDDIFGILALVSSGEPLTDSSVLNSKNFILQNQNSDGGWGFAISSGSDSNMTAAAILALKAAGLSANDLQIQKALSYLKTTQNSDGGFTYDPTSSYGTASDSSSTSWVLWALNALNIDQASWSKEGHTPFEYLISTQIQNGSFEYQKDSGENSLSPTNTAYAVIALEGKTLPLKTLPTFSQQFNFRIEGSNETVCEGKTSGPTALDIVKTAKDQCGYTYSTKDTSFGPYLEKINQDQASGTVGWQYMVNWQSPSVGAADYNLKSGDEVLWYFANFDAKPLKLSLSSTEITSGQPATAFVSENTGQTVSGAEVIAGVNNFATGTDGKANVTSQDGYYKVFAQKPGFVRSNKILLKIGSPASGQVTLSANISGQVEGTSTKPSVLSFTVDPSSLDFGNLQKGQSAQKQMQISNTGTVDLNLQAIVSGDDLFTENLTLNESLWKNFSLELNKQTGKALTAKLTALSIYQGSGQKQGQLVIWATPK